MAIDALKNLTNNVPDWLERLGELSGQIEQRQLELVALGQGDSSAKSVRNKGSNESLLRKDDDEPASPNNPQLANDVADGEPPEGQNETDNPSSPSSPGGLAATSSELKQQTKHAMTVAQARARAQVRKRHRSQSIVSIEGNPAAYRSRSMIIVYYDSYVENFFEGLVKFVSASRNLMRKAKMAAKVAHIKKLAELDNRDDNDDEDDDEDGMIPPKPLPSLRYLSSSRNAAMAARMGARGGMRTPAGEENDLYDQLDKGLEFVQSMCERAAHQFLRDGDCNEEINGITRRLGETKDLAEKEIDRISREEPDRAQDPTEAQKLRTHRPPAVRRDLSVSKEPSAPGATRDFRRAGKAPIVLTGAIDVDEDEALADMGSKPGAQLAVGVLEADTASPSRPSATQAVTPSS